MLPVVYPWGPERYILFLKLPVLKHPCCLGVIKDYSPFPFGPSSIFSGRAASSRLRLFEVISCHVMFLYEKRILCYDMAGSVMPVAHPNPR